MNQPQRQHKRYRLSVPVEFGTSPGLTRDISVGGIYFETSEAVAQGSSIRFWLVLTARFAAGSSNGTRRANGKGPSMRIECNGTVIRVEDLHGRWGVAATIDCFESIAAAFKPVPSPSRSERDRRDH